MKRREFLSVAAKSAAIGATSTTFAVPTIVHAQTQRIRWQMATSWPVSLDTIYGAAEYFAERVAALTDGRFQITPNPAGKLSRGTDILDVVSQGAVPIGHTASYYYIGKSPVTAFSTALPFGMTLRQQNAWLYEGGGLKLLQEIYAKRFNVIHWPAGNTGAQMGGWFRKEVKTVKDLQGLKMRIPGLGGEVMKRLGVTVQTLPGGEIFQALQTGTVDAAEWVGPYDDEKLGFFKVAKFYYYPGWWEPAPSLEIEVNLNEWNKLPKAYQEAIKSAAAEANQNMVARYDARNAAALAKLTAQGVQVKRFSNEILAAAQKAALGLYEEYASKDADFKRVYESWKKFKAETDKWFGLNEYAIEGFLFGAS
ncbi:MAG: ABC transporter substrate-binding protein [Candidatus Roseilinea sp.]|nr:MAG: ABC transporter substrate-binding protein [Candidatus Roseilinea sp.]